MTLPNMPVASVLSKLHGQAAHADMDLAWDVESWDMVQRCDALRWCIPTEFGGVGLGSAELLQAYEALASACLTTCFILTQRDAACRRLVASANEGLRRDLLPKLARGEVFATVGLSQLTTSRQHGKPVFVAREDGDALIFNGVIPWVTGASQAQYLVIGASLDDGRQVLAVLPSATPGVRIAPPMELMALRGSMTAAVHCDQVRLEQRWLLAGPEANVMSGDRGGAGGLQTSCLALGLASAAIGFLREEAVARPTLLAGAERLEQSRQCLCDWMYQLVRAGATPESTNDLRAQANTLVLQATQAALIAAKGAGFVHPHPAQRWARQALFFLVWSCPWPAASATLDHLTFAADQECPG